MLLHFKIIITTTATITGKVFLKKSQFKLCITHTHIATYPHACLEKKNKYKEAKQTHDNTLRERERERERGGEKKNYLQNNKITKKKREFNC